MVGGQVCDGISRGSGLKIVSMMAFSRVQVTPIIHDKRTSERGVKTPTRHKARLSSCTSGFSHGAIVIVQVFQIFAFVFSFRSQVSALCFGNRHSLILWLHCYRFAYGDDSIRKGKSSCVHTTLRTLQLRARSVVWCLLTDTFFHRLWDQAQFNGSQKFTDKKRSSHADAIRKKSHKKFDEQFFSSIFFSTFKSALWY